MKSNKLILKAQQRFRSEKHNVYTEVTNNWFKMIKEYNQLI